MKFLLVQNCTSAFYERGGMITFLGWYEIPKIGTGFLKPVLIFSNPTPPKMSNHTPKGILPKKIRYEKKVRLHFYSDTVLVTYLF